MICLMADCVLPPAVARVAYGGDYLEWRGKGNWEVRGRREG